MTEWNAFDWQREKNPSDGDTLVEVTDAEEFEEECASESASIQLFTRPPSRCHKYAHHAETEVNTVDVISPSVHAVCVFSQVCI